MTYLSHYLEFVLQEFNLVWFCELLFDQGLGSEKLIICDSLYPIDHAEPSFSNFFVRFEFLIEASVRDSPWQKFDPLLQNLAVWRVELVSMKVVFEYFEADDFRSVMILHEKRYT